MWSGALVDIPAGWAICDGTNGTPDLRNQFIIGAGDTYAPGATGGSITHAHSAAADSQQDSIDLWTNCVVTYLDSGYEVSEEYYAPYASYTEEHCHTVEGYTEGHDHTIDVDYDGALPPYYALAFIMKV